MRVVAGAHHVPRAGRPAREKIVERLSRERANFGTTLVDRERNYKRAARLQKSRAKKSATRQVGVAAYSRRQRARAYDF